jgi:multidrug efflux pump subunit AcrB
MEKIAKETLPKGIAYEWTELTYQEILAGDTGKVVFPLAVLLVFLVLAALYESWTLPLAVILNVPMALLAAITGVWLMKGDNNIFTQISLVVLVGLAAKNAILIVEFAQELERRGRGVVDAALEASRLRLRPILMTSFAFIMGVIPLALSTGAGAEMRRAIGIAVFSGMLGVTFFSLLLTTDQVFQTLATYLGSSYVDQFNKFGRVFQIYVQGDAKFRMTPDEVMNLKVRNQNGDMIPLGTVLTITPTVGPSLISLYNLYPSATIVGVPAKGFSSGDTMRLMDEIAEKTLPPGVGSSWTALSFQEKLVGGQIYYVFALAMLLVYLVLAGQYESWYTPLAVLFAVPLSLIGPVAVMLGLRIDNNLYVQIGLVLLIALSAKNAILIVEVARELRAEGKSILDSAVEAARARFRPILMTSFAFILGVAPLVFATGAGASARKSIGITVFSGMIASTCLAVIFVPSMFVVIQRFEEWRKSRKGKATPAAATPPNT